MKRRFPRAPIQVVATCTFGQRRVEGILWQIGEGGLFVELPSIEALPDMLAVAFELPGDGVHHVVARPVWKTAAPLRSAPGSARGAGCEFKEIRRRTRDAIAAYLRKTKQTYSALQFALALDRSTPQLPVLLRETGLERVSDRKALKEHVATVIAQFRCEAR